VFAQVGVDASSLELVVVDNDQAPSAAGTAKTLAGEAPFPCAMCMSRRWRRQCAQRRHDGVSKGL